MGLALNSERLPELEIVEDTPIFCGEKLKRTGHLKAQM
jgi:hypothetical protein